MRSLKRNIAIALVTAMSAAMLMAGCGVKGAAPAATTQVADTQATTAKTVATASDGETSLHVLTKEDITEMYNPDASASFKDATMEKAIVSG